MSVLNKNLTKEYNSKRKIFHRKYLCYAPFSSLKFNQLGLVQTCCHNSIYPVGDFNKETILEIWFGEKIKNLRESIINCKLNYGCDVCKNEILNKNYFGVEALQYDKIPLPKKYPLIFDIQTSDKCNLACIMCKPKNSNQIKAKPIHSINNFNNEKFFNEFDFFVPYLKKIRFSGGEPFMEDFYFALWKKIISIKPEIEIDITSNGTIFNHKIGKIIEKGNFSITLSIDSFLKSTYERIRLNSNFEHVMENFRFFSEISKKKNRQLSINVCVMKENAFEMADILNFSNKEILNVNFLFVKHPISLSLSDLSFSELESIYYFYLKSLNNIHFINNPIIIMNILNFKNLIKKIENIMINKKVKLDTLSFYQILNNICTFISLEMNYLNLLERRKTTERCLLKLNDLNEIIKNERPELYQNVLSYLSGLNVLEIISSIENRSLNEIKSILLNEAQREV